ncbi:hypothetical protein AIOL_003107 [Candidatus Rhodobacter oscarellae]|uniref:Uncharacterized protein n=1 Tax=Candidatus Rhodobacter oscarellae TaxID=1675527 RepID=A0A0J9E662_9RHOB|nr:DUF3108 domain-containing protein [Candidatus Rhodobacter lobularis]KMW58136.1 hypothetical protein AIOL_003107 [Candidatus Rhodobacter lobularis]
MRAILTLIFCAACGAALPVLAGPDRFDLKVAGLRIGVVQMEATESATRYGVQANIRSTGLAAAIRHFSYSGAAAGLVRDGRLVPERYQETADTGRRSSSALMTYRGGVPTVLEYSSPRAAAPDAPDPATQGGTLDPLSAVYALLRDVPATQACTLNVTIFDAGAAAASGWPPRARRTACRSAAAPMSGWRASPPRR